MPFNYCCGCDYFWFRLFYQFYFSLFSYSAHTLFNNKLELVICNLGVYTFIGVLHANWTFKYAMSKFNACNEIMIFFGYMNGHSCHLPWLNHGCKIKCLQPDFHCKNPATCHLTFTTEIRHHFALGDMDCDNYTRRGWAGIYIYTYIMHNASTQSKKVIAYIPKAWPKI